MDLTETEEEDGGEEDEEEGEEKGGDEEEEEEEDEDEGQGGYDDYYDYSLQDSAAQGGPQGSEAVVANDGDRSSFLADVQVGGTTASQRQSAEEYARSQASQLVLSLAQEQPEFKKIKQEVFARGSSFDRARRSETATVSTDATTSVPDAPSFSPLAVRDQTAAQAWMLDGSAVSSGANASQPACQARPSRSDQFGLAIVFSSTHRAAAAAGAVFHHDAEGQAFPEPRRQTLSQSLGQVLVRQLGSLRKWSGSLWRACGRNRHADRLEAVRSKKEISGEGRKPCEGEVLALVIYLRFEYGTGCMLFLEHIKSLVREHEASSTLAQREVNLSDGLPFQLFHADSCPARRACYSPSRPIARSHSALRREVLRAQ